MHINPMKAAVARGELQISQEQAQQWKEAGVLLLVYKSEVEILASGFRDAMKAIRG